MRRLFSLKHEFATEWYRFLQSVTPPVIAFDLTPERFPFQLRGRTITLHQCDVFVLLKRTGGGAPTGSLSISLTKPDRERVVNPEARPDGSTAWPLPPDPSFGNLRHANIAGINAEIGGMLNGLRSYTWSLTLTGVATPAEVEDVVVVCQFTA